eukprot:c18727_g1_i1 orf=94-996(-)
MAEEDATPVPSTPQTPLTPETPVGPIFALPLERISSGSRKSLVNKCFPLDTCGVNENVLPAACAYPPVPSVSLTRKVGAEFIGTFVLIFAAAASAIVNEKTNGGVTLIGLAAAPGLAVMAIILSTGHISGAHLNPCLTLSFAALRHFPWIQVPLYIGAQVSGSISAAFALKGIFHPYLHGGVTVPSGSNWQSFALEFVITFNLMFVVTAVATDTRAVGELAGLAVGATVMLNILIAGKTSGASMNPVRTLGPAIAANNYHGIWLYMVGPILGALAGAAAYSAVRLTDEQCANGRPRSFRR